MTMNLSGSATIYQFPARGRFAANAAHSDFNNPGLIAPSIVPVASASGWYHEEAMLEDERARKN